MWLIAFVSMLLSPSCIQGVRRDRHKIYFACWWDQVVKKTFVSTYVGNWTLYGAVVSVKNCCLIASADLTNVENFFALRERRFSFVELTSLLDFSNYSCCCRDSGEYVCVRPRFCLTSRKNNFPGNFRTLWLFDKPFFDMSFQELFFTYLTLSIRSRSLVPTFVDILRKVTKTLTIKFISIISYHVGDLLGVSILTLSGSNSFFHCWNNRLSLVVNYKIRCSCGFEDLIPGVVPFIRRWNSGTQTSNITYFNIFDISRVFVYYICNHK